jgi:hypothetical protein
MNYLYNYHEFLDESFFPISKKDMIETFKKFTDKDSILKYLKSLFTYSNKMEKRLKYYFISSFVIIALSSTTLLKTTDVIDIAPSETKLMLQEILDFKIDNQLDEYLEAIAKKESTNRPYIVNQLGYIGKYQFHNLALIDAGVVKTKDEAKKFRKKFINSSEEDRIKMWSEAEQDQAMINLMKKNKQYLKNYSDYVGKTINDIEITWSGLLAAAHLGGQKHVKEFLESDGKKDFADANEVKISVYLKEFSGYKLIGI